MTGPQPPYPGQPVPPPHGYAYGPPAPARPRSTSTTGPKVTVAVGVVVLLAAVAAFVLGIVAVVRLAPTDVLRLDGSTGEGVLASVSAPGTGTVDLAADTDYALFLVRTGSASGRLSAPPAVTGPGGSQVSVGPATVSMNVDMSGTHAEAIASFRAVAAGPYVIEAPAPADGGEAQLYVVRDAGMSSFLGGLFGGVAGILGGVFLGLVALVLLVVGGILWGVRRGNARAQGLR